MNPLVTLARAQGLGAGPAPGLHSIDEIKAQQAKVAGNAAIIDAAVRSCGTLDEPTRTAWGVFYTRCIDYSHKAGPPAALLAIMPVQYYLELDRLWSEGQGLLVEQEEWANTLRDKCKVPKISTGTTPGAVEEVAGSVERIAKAIGILALVTVGSYAVYAGVSAYRQRHRYY